MRYLAIIVLIGILAACGHKQPTPTPVPIPAVAKNTLTWPRNSEVDMQDYRVYVCWMPPPHCDEWTNWALVAVVPQTPLGVKPTYWRDLAGSVGAYAFTARDTYGNESALSAPVPFDRR